MLPNLKNLIIHLIINKLQRMPSIPSLLDLRPPSPRSMMRGMGRNGKQRGVNFDINQGTVPWRVTVSIWPILIMKTCDSAIQYPSSQSKVFPLCMYSILRCRARAAVHLSEWTTEGPAEAAATTAAGAAEGEGWRKGKGEGEGWSKRRRREDGREEVSVSF